MIAPTYIFFSRPNRLNAYCELCKNALFQSISIDCKRAFQLNKNVQKPLHSVGLYLTDEAFHMNVPIANYNCILYCCVLKQNTFPYSLS